MKQQNKWHRSTISILGEVKNMFVNKLEEPGEGY
jgi:hypothetical protein